MSSIYPNDILLRCQPPSAQHIEMLQEAAAMIAAALPGCALKLMMWRYTKVIVVTSTELTEEQATKASNLVRLVAGKDLAVACVTECGMRKHNATIRKELTFLDNFGMAWDIVKHDPRA